MEILTAAGRDDLGDIPDKEPSKVWTPMLCREHPGTVILIL